MASHLVQRDFLITMDLFSSKGKSEYERGDVADQRKEVLLLVTTWLLLAEISGIPFKEERVLSNNQRAKDELLMRASSILVPA